MHHMLFVYYAQIVNRMHAHRPCKSFFALELSECYIFGTLKKILSASLVTLVVGRIQTDCTFIHSFGLF